MDSSWNISPEWLSQQSVKGGKPLETILLNTDFKECGAAAIPDDINSGRVPRMPRDVVLQVSKIRNISAPTDNPTSQGAPRMLRIHLTDGHSKCVALEFDHCPQYSMNTPPGTKVFIPRDTQIVKGFILLNKSCKNLGGKVEALVNRWQLQQDLAYHKRKQTGVDGPPPFLPFSKEALSNAKKEIRERKAQQSRTKKQPQMNNAAENDGDVENIGRAKLPASSAGQVVFTRPDSLQESRRQKLQDSSKQQGRERRGRRRYDDDEEDDGTMTLEEHMKKKNEKSVDPNKVLPEVSLLVEMGFPLEQSRRAVQECGTDINVCIAYLSADGGNEPQAYRNDYSRDNNREDRGRRKGGRRGRYDDIAEAPSGPALWDFVKERGGDNLSKGPGKPSDYGPPPHQEQEASQQYEQFSSHTGNRRDTQNLQKFPPRSTQARNENQPTFRDGYGHGQRPNQQGKRNQSQNRTDYKQPHKGRDSPNHGQENRNTKHGNKKPGSRSAGKSEYNSRGDVPRNKYDSRSGAQDEYKGRTSVATSRRDGGRKNENDSRADAQGKQRDGSKGGQPKGDKKPKNNNKLAWKIGDSCVAVYSADGLMYNATIEKVESAGSFKVVYEGFENEGSYPVTAAMLLTHEALTQQLQQPPQQQQKQQQNFEGKPKQRRKGKSDKGGKTFDGNHKGQPPKQR